MATSGSTDWILTKNEIITDALSDIGAVAAGETPASEDTALASRTLNAMAKVWLAEGIGLWLEDRVELTLTANTQSYTIGSGGDLDTVRPIEIIDAQYHYYTSGIDVPMSKMSRSEYFELSLKSATGTPLNFYYDPKLTLGIFYIWPVVSSSTSDTIKMTVRTEVEDFDNANDNADFPKEWILPLRYNLAVLLAPSMGREPGQALQVLAAYYKQVAKDWDREKDVSVYFGRERRR